MDILFVCKRIPFPPNFNGNTIINYHILKRLSRRHNIDIVTFESQNIDIYKNEISDFFRNIYTVEYKEPKNKFLQKIATVLKWKPSFFIDQNIEMKNLIKELVERKDYDSIYTSLLEMSVYTYQLNNIHSVLSPSDSMTYLFNSYLETNSDLFQKIKFFILKYIYMSYERSIYPKYDKCIFVSDKDKEFVEKNIFGQVDFIPNGVDEKYFSPKNNIVSKENELIFTGVMNFKPNIDAAIYFAKEILPILLKNNPKLIFKIVGKNPSESIKKLENKNVIVTGYVEDIRKHFWESNIYVSPMISGGGIKNKILEAMSIGKPIVATPRSCNGINLKDEYNIMIAKNKYEFASKINILLNDEKLKTKISRNARQTIEKKYSWGIIAKKYEELLNTK